MKPKPAVFAALMVVAALVSAESAVVFDRAGRVADAWSARARTTMGGAGFASVAKTLVRAFGCAAKS